jgi:hypothetical protein
MTSTTHTAKKVQEPLTQTIVNKVATAAADDVTELPPLYETIDPDALEALLDSSPPDTWISFSYHGFVVTVTGDRTVSLSDEQ